MGTDGKEIFLMKVEFLHSAFTAIRPLGEFSHNEKVKERIEILSTHSSPSQLWVAPSQNNLAETAAAWVAHFYCQAAEDLWMKPCGHCSACRQLKTGTFGEVRWLKPSDDKTYIKVDEIRDFTAWIYLRSMHGTRRFGIIEDAHQLNKSGQNALLKVFEEVPPGVTLLLLTSQPSALLPTIRSRSMIFRWALNEDFHAQMTVDEEEHLREFLGWFSLGRADFACRFQELVGSAEWRKSFLSSMVALSQCAVDLWRYQTTLGAKENLLYPKLEGLYKVVVEQWPGVDWKDVFDKCEAIERQKQRNFQDQLVLEGLFYPLFLGETVIQAHAEQ